LDSLPVKQKSDVLGVGDSLPLTVLVHEFFKLRASLDFEENFVVVLPSDSGTYLRPHFEVDDLGVSVGGPGLGI